MKRFLYIAILVVVIGFTSCFNRDRGEAYVIDSDSIVIQTATRWDIPLEGYIVVDSTIGRNEMLSSILSRYGVNNQTIHNVERESLNGYSVRRLRSGNRYHLLIDTTSSPHKADYFIYDINSIEYVVYRLKDSIYSSYGVLPTDTTISAISGRIVTSLWNSMIEQGATPNLTGMLSDIYSWTIDFFGIQPNDSFTLCYESIYTDTTFVGVGRILAANFITGGKDHFAFYYKYRDDRGEYFDENGESLRRAFLKAPLRYSRISSHFSNARRHPITKVVRPHHGVDYAAPAGTPVYSVGDGVVIGRGWDNKGGGNYVRIKHNSTYTTLYMHLKGFASGLKQGDRVSQGQLIGYVGSTGMSTGPHLDYRVYKNGTAINPLNMDLPAVEPIAQEDIDEYISGVLPYMSMIGFTPSDTVVAIEDKE